MSAWEELLQEAQETSVNAVRQKYLKKLSEKTGRNVIAYYSGFLMPDRDFDTDINDNDMNGFIRTVRGLDPARGLDLILHTPGGRPTSAEAIVNYLHTVFGNNIRVIVPYMAMSAGTMIACSARTILMGNYSCLGPVDAQIGGIPAYNIVKIYENAKEELARNPDSLSFWSIELQKIHYAMLPTAQDAIELSDILVSRWLRRFMFEGESGSALDNKVRRILRKLNSNNKDHGRHFSYELCKQIGMNVELLENDPQLEELVLGIHHAYNITMVNYPVSKLIENQEGALYVTQYETEEE